MPEKVVMESKLKEVKKQYDVDIKELQIEVKNLTKTNKTKEKEIFKLNPILENTLTTLKNEKSEQSKLKTYDDNANKKVADFNTEKDDTETKCFFTTSMVSHWNPQVIHYPQRPGSIPTIFSHCALLPPPGSSFPSMAEVLQGLESAFEKMLSKMNWFDKTTICWLLCQLIDL